MCRVIVQRRRASSSGTLSPDLLQDTDRVQQAVGEAGAGRDEVDRGVGLQHAELSGQPRCGRGEQAGVGAATAASSRRPVPDWAGAAAGRRRRASPCGLAHPGLAGGVDVAPAGRRQLVAGPRTEASRRSGTGAAATGRCVEPDVLPTAGVRRADRTRTFNAGGTGHHARRPRRPKTTKLDDRRADTGTVDEVERIVI